LKKISSAAAPVLLCQGLDDDVVPISQLKHYEAELKKGDIPVETFLIKNASHNFSSVDNDKILFSRTVQWFAKTLK
jgi:dipeptidyl aminopeptidase/acylaminoacyl peptidase